MEEEAAEISALLEILRPIARTNISTADSRFGGASGAFDGTGDWLQTNDAGEFNWAGAEPFAIEAWVNGTGTLFSNDNYGIIVSIKSGTELRLWINNVLVWDFTGTLAGSLPAGWHHVALSYDGTTYRVFVDGSESFSVAGMLPSQVNDYLKVGAYGNGTQPCFSGYIDEFRVTRGAARYTTNFTPPKLPFADN